MKLYLRLLWLLLTQSRRSRCSLVGPCETTLRVYPNDIDIFGHVNNGVYLTMMDLGRTDMMLRSGIFGKIRVAGWYPVVASETIRFRRSLKLGQRFSIHTSVAGWDDKSVFLLQQFVRSGEVVAEAAVNARFLARTGGSVATADLMSVLEYKAEAPVLPAWISDWQRSVDDMSMSSISLHASASDR